MKIRAALLLVPVLVAIAYIAKGQEAKDTVDIADTLKSEDDLKLGHRFLYDMKRIGGGVGYVYSRPVHWEGKDWLRFGGTVGIATLMAATVDEPLGEYLQDNQTESLDKLESFLFRAGKPGLTYIFTGALYSAGLFANNEWLRDTGVALTITLTTAGLIQTGAKTAFGRARPSTGVGAWEYKPFDSRPGYHSLPSGHIIMILSTAYVIGRRIDFVPGKIALYTVAAGVGLSRLYANAHFSSDLFLGSVLTIACAETAIRFVERGKEQRYTRYNGPRKVRWDVSPSIGGLTLTGRF